MVPKLTLIPNLKINIVTKFQVFKHHKIRGGKAKLATPNAQ